MLSITTIVLVPGLLCDRTVWSHFITRIGERVPVTVADLTSQNSITAMAEDTLDSCPGQLYVAGYSMGGRVAFEMVRLAKDRIKKLALLDTGVHPRKQGEEIRRKKLVDMAYANGMRALAEEWLPPFVHPDRHSDRHLMEMLTAMVERMSPEIHEIQINALLNRPDVRPLLSEINCETLLMAGRQDTWAPVAQHEDICRKLVNSSLVVVENAGHFAPVERPGIVSAELEKWAFD